MKKTTKHDQVKAHLKSKRQISSLEAIKLFSATRLSAIIYNLRRKECWFEKSIIPSGDKLEKKSKK